MLKHRVFIEIPANTDEQKDVSSVPPWPLSDMDTTNQLQRSATHMLQSSSSSSGLPPVLAVGSVSSDGLLRVAEQYTVNDNKSSNSTQRQHTATLFTVNTAQCKRSDRPSHHHHHRRRHRVSSLATGNDGALVDEVAVEEMRWWVADRIVAKRRRRRRRETRLVDQKHDDDDRHGDHGSSGDSNGADLAEEKTCVQQQQQEEQEATTEAPVGEEYLVKWKYSPHHESTWMSLEDVSRHYPYHLHRFRKRHERFEGHCTAVSNGNGAPAAPPTTTPTTPTTTTTTTTVDHQQHDQMEGRREKALEQLSLSLISSLYRSGNMRVLLDDDNDSSNNVVNLRTLGGSHGVQTLMLENAHLIKEILHQIDNDSTALLSADQLGQISLAEDCQREIERHFLAQCGAMNVQCMDAAERDERLEQEKKKLRLYIQQIVSGPDLPGIHKDDGKSSKVFH